MNQIQWFSDDGFENDCNSTNTNILFKEGVMYQKSFNNFFAVVLNPDGYGDELEIQYVKKKFNYNELNPLDFDSRPKSDLMKVYPVIDD